MVWICFERFPIVECPGGADSPCNYHGNCSDGVEGQGYCVCDEGYLGEACEQCVTEECLQS